MKKLIIITISWIFVALWMGVIFAFSEVNGTKSTDDSRKIIEKTIEKTVETTDKSGITNIHPENKDIKKVSKSLDYPFRKVVHVLVYFVLALLVCNALYQSGLRVWKLYLISIIICVIYAITDEIHQLHTERSGEVKDVFIDSIGILIGNVIYNRGLHIFKKRRSNK